MELTPAELTLLGLLVEKPRHGYELEEVITARGMRDWTEIGFSSIYYLLTKLRAKGLIAETGEPARGKARKVYAPTPEGFRACAAGAEETIATLTPVFPPVLVGLANQPTIPAARLHDALARRAEALADKITEVRAAAARERVPPFVRAIFDYSLTQLEAEQRWLAAYRGEL
ncbi:PadR family transcriptional regulator [Actinophytocola oryzae]|uniref:PadR family transcriptional regulator n=1 Tax=Actinophytocola oryzae TaxID=502181 RepID=A0A4R7V7G1_9PSEU|nr:PadR family transcriptional regulator [Actinophytocola oryzae]TDV43616.1 PadR family transcriptional regulator [Actinophytocola oryzae]